MLRVEALTPRSTSRRDVSTALFDTAMLSDGGALRGRLEPLLSSLRGLTAAASLRALSSCELTTRTLRLALQQLQQLPGDQLVQQTIRSYAKADEPLLAPEVRPLLRRELAGLRLPDAGLHLHPVGDAFVCVRDEDGDDADGGATTPAATIRKRRRKRSSCGRRRSRVRLIVFEEAGSLRAALAAAGAHPGAADALSELTKAARGAVTRATTRLLLERLDSMHELDERLLRRMAPSPSRRARR